MNTKVEITKMVGEIPLIKLPENDDELLRNLCMKPTRRYSENRFYKKLTKMIYHINRKNNSLENCIKIDMLEEIRREYIKHLKKERI